ncbi:MAG: helix-turn-helix transcriptional regulator [Exiguobacterium sp.]|nr:helix-turn-helix transcriptional regulator [Exiguobacterium sp.]
MKTNLKQLRKAAGWSNADKFAMSINMSPKTYRNYEQGIRSIGLDVASEICNALGCSINDLVTEQVNYAFVSLNEDLTDDERELLACYRSLSTKGKHAVLVGLRDFANGQ